MDPGTVCQHLQIIQLNAVIILLQEYTKRIVKVIYDQNHQNIVSYYIVELMLKDEVVYLSIRHDLAKQTIENLIVEFNGVGDPMNTEVSYKTNRHPRSHDDHFVAISSVVKIQDRLECCLFQSCLIW